MLAKNLRRGASLETHHEPWRQKKTSLIFKFLFTDFDRLLVSPAGTAHEENRGDHQTIQAGGREGSPVRHRRGGNDGQRSQRFWPPERSHRNLSRQRIHRRFSSE